MLKRLRNAYRCLSNITEDDLKRLGVEVEKKKTPIKIIRREDKEAKKVRLYLEKNKFNNINLEDIYD